LDERLRGGYVSDEVYTLVEERGILQSAYPFLARMDYFAQKARAGSSSLQLSISAY
jgi:hypothetical protein